MPSNRKIFGNLDLQDNEIKGLKLENITSASIEALDFTGKSGKLIYESDTHIPKIVVNDELKSITTGDSLNTIQVNSSLQGPGNVTVDSNSKIILKEGDNVTLEYDTDEKSITLNAVVESTHENYTEVFGDASNLEYNINHDLGTTNVIVTVLTEEGESVTSTFRVLQYEIVDEDNINIIVNEAPGVDKLRVVINSRTGFRGVAGFQGFQGNKGPQGIRGFQGFKGNQGIKGPQGFKGNQGIKGNQGNSADGSGILTVKGTLSSAQILASYSTPITLLVPSGGGTFLDIHSITIQYEFGSIAYNWSVVSGFKIGGATSFIGTVNNTLVSGIQNGFQKIQTVFAHSPINTYYVIGGPLLFISETGNPTTGDGEINYEIKYSNVSW